MTTPATGAFWSRIRLAAADIKIAHSVFALPFALLAAGMSLSADETGRSAAIKLGLVIWCMVTARTWAMLFNRLADRRLDAGNPRTQRRALASGSLTAPQGWALALGSAGLFVVGAAGFWVFFGNVWPPLLALPVLAWIAFYSLTKRFTALCHIFLGSALALSPVAAALAVRPEALAESPAIWLLAGMVLPWVAGFDIIYALADMEFDRSSGLHSVPAKLGASGAAWASRGLHVLAIGSLAAAGVVEPRFGAVFAAGVALVAGLLVAEHIVLVRRGLAGIPVAFFTLNGVVSCVVGGLGGLDLVL